MINFTYNKAVQERSVEDILNYNKKKLHRQHLIYMTVFIVIMVLLGIYAYQRTVYGYFDGYVKVNQNHIRSIDDIFILEIHKTTGDSIHTGDTLYSYVLLNNLLDQHNLSSVPVILNEIGKQRSQAQLLRQEIPGVRVRIQNLQQQIEHERNNVYYGLADNSRLLALEAELRVQQSKLTELVNKANLLYSMAGNTQHIYQGVGVGQGHLPYEPAGSSYTGPLVKYACATCDGVITDIKTAVSTVVFKQEEVLTIQNNDYMASNLGVLVWVPAPDVNTILNKPYVEVVVNEEYILRAKVQLLGLRVEEIPRHLLSNFSHDINAIVAYLCFEPGQRIPSWILTNDLPVRVRVNRWIEAEETQTVKYLEIGRDSVFRVDSLYKTGVRKEKE